MTAKQLDVVLLRSFNHLPGLVQVQGHRFFHHHVLAVLGGGDGVFAVELVGGGNPDDIHFRVLAKLFHAVVGTPFETGLEGVQGLLPHVCGGNQLKEVGILHSGDHLARPGSQPGNCDFHLSLRSLAGLGSGILLL
jgi:hypothetical protein